MGNVIGANDAESRLPSGPPRSKRAPPPHPQNTLEAPQAIAPTTATRHLTGTDLSLPLPPYSYTLVRIPGK